jgi:hypothetical protein
MTSPVVLCSMGRTLDRAGGGELLDPGARLVLVTVMDEPDPTMTGTGLRVA